MTKPIRLCMVVPHPAWLSVGGLGQCDKGDCFLKARKSPWSKSSSGPAKVDRISSTFTITTGRSKQGYRHGIKESTFTGPLYPHNQKRGAWSN